MRKQTFQSTGRFSFQARKHLTQTPPLCPTSTSFVLWGVSWGCGGFILEPRPLWLGIRVSKENLFMGEKLRRRFAKWGGRAGSGNRNQILQVTFPSPTPDPAAIKHSPQVPTWRLSLQGTKPASPHLGRKTDTHTHAQPARHGQQRPDRAGEGHRESRGHLFQVRRPRRQQRHPHHRRV